MQKMVLVIDDDPDARDFVIAVLEDTGLHVHSARDGKAGLEAAHSERPELIVLDVQMPKKDGFTVLSELRADEATQGVPVVMLTGVAEETGVRFSKSAVGDLLGVEPNAYVEKPVDPEELRSTVLALLGEPAA